MSARLTVESYACPPVGEKINSPCAQIYHGFNGDCHAGNEPCSPAETGVSVVRNLGRFVHIGADTVADKLTNDAIAVLIRMSLNCSRNI